MGSKQTRATAPVDPQERISAFLADSRTGRNVRESTERGHVVLLWYDAATQAVRAYQCESLAGASACARSRGLDASTTRVVSDPYWNDYRVRASAGLPPRTREAFEHAEEAAEAALETGQRNFSTHVRGSRLVGESVMR